MNCSHVSYVSSTNDIEKHIAYCARVSNPTNQNNLSFDKLLRYCIRNHHWSIFEHGFVTLEIKTSRTISRQILRHRSFTFQEFSQRYAITPNSPILFQARRQDLKNRQNSIDDVGSNVKEWFLDLQRDNWERCYLNYMAAIEMGIAKEQARVLLPEGTCPTTIYMTGSVRSWIHFIQLRIGNGSQKEISEIANLCKIELLKLCPTIFSCID